MAALASILPSRYGCSAFSFMTENVGPITKMVRNSEKPTSTWFGGIDGVPSALRRNPSTIRIRVKPVIMISSDGPIVMSVNRPRIERFVPGSWLLPGSGIDSAGSADCGGTAGAAWAATAPSASSATSARSSLMARERRRIGR